MTLIGPPQDEDYHTTPLITRPTCPPQAALLSTTGRRHGTGLCPPLPILYLFNQEWSLVLPAGDSDGRHPRSYNILPLVEKWSG